MASRAWCRGDYIACFGDEGVEAEILIGNCTSMPYAAGTVRRARTGPGRLQLRMLPYLSTTEATECVTGSPCTVALPGYGIPSSLVVAGVLDGAYGSGTVCGMGSGLVAVDTLRHISSEARRTSRAIAPSC